MNEKFVDIVTELDTFWTLSQRVNADAVQRMLDLELVSDAGNATIGDFDCARVDGLIEKLRPVFEAKGVTSPPTRVRPGGHQRVHRPVDRARQPDRTPYRPSPAPDYHREPCSAISTT